MLSKPFTCVIALSSMKEGPGLSYLPLYSPGPNILSRILEPVQKDLLNKSSQQPYEGYIIIILIL